MFIEISGLPSFVFGVTATGEITHVDIEGILLPGLERLVENNNEIYYLLVLNTDVDNITAESWVQDFQLGIKNFTKWKKIAVVTDQSGVEKFTDIFSLGVPGNSRGFKMSELEEAKTWICTRED